MSSNLESKSGYNLLINFGRILDKGTKFPPEAVINIVNKIEKDLRFTPIKTSFQLFPPIKDYEEHGFWNYKSACEKIKNEFGTHFGKGDLHMLLLRSLYENHFVAEVGLAYIMAISAIRKRNTGITLIEEFMSNEQGD